MAHIQQKIVPNLWFDHKAKEAVDFYLSVFPDSKMGEISYYPTEGLEDFQQEFAGKELTISFEISGQRFLALNAGSEFTFNEAVSFVVNCKDQEEIDYFWEKLTADGGQESVCGWLKDKYGLSWQIVPENIDTLVSGSKPKAFAALLQMKKIDIAVLQNASGEE